ncbi:unnamed protein product [Prunus armeniaca]
MQGSGGSSSKSTSTTAVWPGQEGAQAPCPAYSGFQHPRQEVGPSKLGKLKGKTSPSSCLGTVDVSDDWLPLGCHDNGQQAFYKGCHYSRE